MADQIEIGERLKQARIAAGFKSARAAAEALGVPTATYTQHENGRRGIGREADVYVRRFRVSLDWLMFGKGPAPRGLDAGDFAKAEDTDAGIPNAVRPKPNASFPPIYQRFDGSASTKLLGQVSGGPNGRFILNGTEVGRVFTPPGLEGVEDAYAVRVWGTSMEPRFVAGETVWINPHEPVRSGNDVVVQLLTDEEYERESYIKKFISQSSKVLRLWQHNPDEGETNEIEIDARRVFSVHKIVFHDTA